MKKNILILSSALLFGATVFMVGCKKDDTTAPVVTIIGQSEISILLQDSYVDQSATANDDEDGVITVVATTDLNTNKVGVYTVTYSATDAAGNEGTATRTVTVKNGSEAWEGKYNGHDSDATGPYVYNPTNDPAKVITVTVSSSVKNRIFMTRLGDFANNTVYLNITGTNIDLPSQDIPNVGSASTPPTSCDIHTRRSSGTGVKTATGFILNYTDENLLPAPCGAKRLTVKGTFTKK